MDSSVDISPSELGHGEGQAAGKTAVSMLPQPDSFVQDMVSKNQVVVFSKSHCPHCTDSKSLLAERGVDFKSVELDELPEGPQLQNVLGAMTDARTVPRVFINGQCVGGNSDLQTLDRSGKLDKMLGSQE